MLLTAEPSTRTHHRRVRDVLTDPGTFDEVVEVLDDVHHLKYVGAGSARLP
ncbi:hypothetical protein SAMN04490220_2012 [Rhodococcus jostii]|uniref:Uncharacterized protein n=1 Tax=Rhodococcus jostii TaxID=132919 RepID=A0A1H4TNQ2_RHOJO|nr:hypothetical protein SAMN04490220_2012 [Rhodococcus jostii]